MTQEDKEKLKEGVVWKSFIERPPGGWGQIAGWPPGHLGARLIHEELEFEVGVNYKRSQTENKQLCMLLFELFLDDIK